MKKLKSIESILYWAVLTVLLCVAGIATMSAFDIPNGYKLFVVQSGSMEPTIKTGSIVVVQPEVDYQKDDIITFKDPVKQKIIVTHRIYEVKDVKNNQITFKTKGDANKSPDSNGVTKSQILGKEIFSIPYLGYPVSFAKTKEGLLVLIIIPCVIIIYSELLTIKNETIRLLSERKKRKLSIKEKIEEKIGEEIIAVEKEAKQALS